MDVVNEWFRWNVGWIMGWAKIKLKTTENVSKEVNSDDTNSTNDYYVAEDNGIHSWITFLWMYYIVTCTCRMGWLDQRMFISSNASVSVSPAPKQFRRSESEEQFIFSLHWDRTPTLPNVEQQQQQLMYYPFSFTWSVGFGRCPTTHICWI